MTVMPKMCIRLLLLKYVKGNGLLEKESELSSKRLLSHKALRCHGGNLAEILIHEPFNKTYSVSWIISHPEAVLLSRQYAVKMLIVIVNALVK